ncbi:MAG: T9SS type A sorting domain-containing protein, partial [Melioribacteraceae bacterium]|nr:T9SS type A sorting domain-containing protein [Melioribacteraceae bacterium]
PDNDFIRPKWGIYRSLNDSSSLRDEAVRFADFSIQEQKVTYVEQSDESMPQYFELYQNYPNPFNPTTIISYAIPENGFVSLAVYDILGNQIIQLENDYKSAGKYSKSFNSRKLSSGIYFYSIRIGNFTATRKMLIMK